MEATDLYPDPEGEQSAALIEALRQQQKRQQAERAGLQGTLARQQGQAGNLRTLSLLSSLGDNPLLRGIRQTAGEQGAQLEGLAARTEQRLAHSGADLNPVSLAQLRLSAEKMKQQGTLQDQRLKQAADRLALLRAKAQAAGVKTDAPAKQPLIPAGEASRIGQVDAAIDGIRQLGKQFDELGAEGLSAIALAKVPGSPQQRYEASARAAMQAVGTILEGGKLAAGDELKYAKMLPAAGDSKKMKEDKVANMVRLLEQAKAASLSGLGKAGYNTSGFAQDRPPDVNLDAPSPKAAPAPADGGPRIVSVKGMKPGDLAASLQEGETVRVPMGGGKYAVVRKKGGKLVKVKE